MENPIESPLESLKQYVEQLGWLFSIAGHTSMPIILDEIMEESGRRYGILLDDGMPDDAFYVISKSDLQLN